MYSISLILWLYAWTGGAGIFVYHKSLHIFCLTLAWTNSTVQLFLFFYFINIVGNFMSFLCPFLHEQSSYDCVPYV